LYDKKESIKMTTMNGALFEMIEVRVPKLFPTHTIREILTVERWHVQEGDILQPGALMVSLETPPGFFDIPAPPEVTMPHRVKHIHVAEGEEIRLDDSLITLEPAPGSE
jgi:pyruvate/2-oxoglutarate dehydrogenase complex dihydrolipoamide acyltransferase (E2) component